VPRERVRVARGIARPDGIPARAKWIHVDLSEQTLVAYEGDRPVFATLVSTGREDTGHATPTGLFWVGEKHVTVTMSGEDPVDGYYEVAEVPWTQFYDGSYALHGAYWHDTFGKTRSHGCTNISPSDARWLFHWTDGEVRPGFHARRGMHGTGVYITSDAQETRGGATAS
jgi:lipoprotein-anchoring transpeptidase ErfK/SrfK